MDHRVFISLGTNLGNRVSNLSAAQKALAPEMRLVRASSIFETEPWGFQEQPPFLNQVLEMDTALFPPQTLLVFVKTLEIKLGREQTFHYGPRLIDIDILLYDMLMMDTPDLIIPHPQLPDRAFVLVPLAEIAPNLKHPVLNMAIIDLLQKIDQKGIRQYP